MTITSVKLFHPHWGQWPLSIAMPMAQGSLKAVKTVMAVFRFLLRVVCAFALFGCCCWINLILILHSFSFFPSFFHMFMFSFLLLSSFTSSSSFFFSFLVRIIWLFQLGGSMNAQGTQTNSAYFMFVWIALFLFVSSFFSLFFPLWIQLLSIMDYTKLHMILLLLCLVFFLF